MHIPDGFLSVPVAASTGVISAGVVGTALRRVRPEAEPELAARMGVMAAYVFAAQMVNFPVAAGTSGHLLGATLAAIALGPHAATVVMAAVFLIQTFFFLDGGHTALGANVLNMGIAGTYGGYAVYRSIAGAAPTPRRSLWATGAAAWFSVMLGAVLTAAQLALSGTIAGGLVFPAMVGVHALIGAGEAAITVAAVALLWRVRPDLLTGRAESGERRTGWTWVAVGLALVAVLAPFASSSPDGLEWVAGRLGFEEHARDPGLPGPFPDYSLPGTEAGWVPALVSVLGAVIMFAALAPLAVLARGSVGGRATPAHAALDPRVKLLGTLGLVFTAVLLPAGQAGKLWLLLALALGWVTLSRVPARWLLGRALLLLPFVGLAALSAPQLREAGGPGLSWYGLLFLKAGVSLAATAAFAATTSEPQALAAMGSLGLPRGLSHTIALALRYLRVMGEEAGRMLQARACRGGGATLALRTQSTGGMVGSLFLRSWERSDRVSSAMVARGFRGDLIPFALARPGLADYGFLIGLGCFLMGVWVWR
ncbi:MAG: energy-coupling factor ABC transporter permease [Armatimonadota bacterium]